MHESRVYILTFIPLAHSVRILIDNYELLHMYPISQHHYGGLILRLTEHYCRLFQEIA